MAPSDLRAAFELYIACKPIRPRDNTTLLSYLAEYPDFLPPVDLVPSDELEQRLEIAHEIQKHIQSDIEWQLSAVHLAILMVIPLESLRTVMLSLPVTDPEDLIKSLNSIHALTCHFFQTLSQSSKKEFAQARVAGSTSKSSESSGQHGRNMKVSKTVSGKRKTRNDDDEYSPRIGPDGFVARDQTERDICLKRERHACLASEAAFPEACHIVPFAFNSNDENMDASHALISRSRKLFWADRIVLNQLLSENLGSSDKSWNMLALSPQIHDWWGKGLLAFRCMGIIPETSSITLMLQIRWMPFREVKELSSRRLVDLDNECDDVLRDLKSLSMPPKEPVSVPNGGRIAVSRSKSSLKIISGDIFKIQLGNEEAMKMKHMIDVQWLMISILALSGAAGSPELFGEPDPDQVRLILTNSAIMMEPVLTTSDERAGQEGGPPASPKEARSESPILTASPRQELRLGVRGISANVPLRPSIGGQSPGPKPLTEAVESESSSQPRKATISRSSAYSLPPSPIKSSPSRSPERNAENERPS